ncbi:autophagy-related protein 11-like [Camellia sinensis]|uniref:autophagy-related protein 11-like n=1 Tax=Camellia sinensis TaxID=4442 RepID=UPI001036013B|nr:autophagy-related protein 11-like [Camellia sinensis]
MGRQKVVAKDLLAGIPDSVDAQPAPTQPKPKTKRIKKAQPKATVTQIDSEDTLSISKLAESEKTTSVPEKRSAETQPSEFTRSKRPRSSAATTSGSRKHDSPWAPQVTLEDRPVMASDSADDINAIQHAHSFSVQSFENREKLAKKKREVSSLQKTNKSLQSKMKTLEDQAEAAIKAQNVAEEKADSAEAIKKVLEAEKKDAEEKTAQAQKELQEALATKDAELKAADEKGYKEGVANVTADYEKQEKQLTQDEEGDEVPKDATAEKASVDMFLADKSLDETLQEIDVELAAEKAVEVSSQQSSKLQTQPPVVAEESLL